MEDMSLQHWIKGALIPLKWVEKVTNVPLTFNAEKQRFEAEIVWLPNFLDEGRGWVYFDAVGSGSCVLNSIPNTEQTTRITVYNESAAVISGSNYTVNYNDGAIVAVGGNTTPQGVPTTVDFTQYYASVIDGWPGTEPPELPVVAVELGPYDKQPFQLGGGRKAVRNGIIHIFASSSAERDDLTEFLFDALYNRHIPVLDFREGEPLNYDGTFNAGFSGNILQIHENDDALFYFRNVKAVPINLRGTFSDLNKFRSKVTFIMESYRDGLDFNAL
jgi:hypothetical protein